jgi:hypothetical protein
MGWLPILGRPAREEAEHDPITLSAMRRLCRAQPTPAFTDLDLKIHTIISVRRRLDTVIRNNSISLTLCLPNGSLMMSYYYSRSGDLKINRLPSGLFFRVDQAEQLRHRDIAQSAMVHDELNYNNFVVPEYCSTKDDKELYLPLLEVIVEVEAVATIAWTKLTQTFTNRATHPINEATYCFPLYDKSTVTAFTCTIGSDKVFKGVVKPKSQAKAEFKEAVARQRVAALLEEHTPEVFETSVGNIPAQTTIKIEICYITELKADLSGDGILVTIPTSVAPRYGAPPSSISSMNSSKALAIPPENGLQIQIQVSSPVAISKIESRTHPVSVEMGSYGHTTTRDIRDLSETQQTPSFDPKKARATLSDRSACLGKDFVLLVQSRDGKLLASRALIEPHPMIPNHSALMVSINLRDVYIPNVVSPKGSSEIIFLADRSGSMQDKMETLKTAMRFFLKSLPNNCSFNICSFGNSYALMWPESRPYNQENVDAALSYVTIHFAADMGGTELLSGLRHVVQKSNSSVNTEVIILTDGEVWDSNNIFEFIRETRSSGPKEKTRFFCLGIGEAVSHHLVTGIGRHGGGLAEVVPVDAAGEWMRRVIGMLGAALTPSSWKVEIVLDDLSISDKKSEAGLRIQAPYHIPEFNAFSRSSVYFLLSQELSAKVVKVKATAVASGESVTAELQIEKLETRRTCVHLLAAKAVLGDLERGQSWLHDTSSNNNNANIKAGIDDLARTEGEKIGAEWQISSKWTSFIVVDDRSSLEKPSRWYPAEKSDLAELTRPRLGAGNYAVQPTNLLSLMPRARDFSSGGYYLREIDAEMPEESVKLKFATSSVRGLGWRSSLKPSEIGGRAINSPQPRSPPLIQELTLEALLDSSTATGAFMLTVDLRTALSAKFKPTLRKSVQDWSAIVLQEDAKFKDVEEVLDTAMSVVYIEEIFTSNKTLWSLLVQKAMAWLESLLPVETHRESLFAILESGLRDLSEGVNVEHKRDNEMAGSSLRSNKEGKEAENLKGWDMKRVMPRKVTKDLAGEGKTKAKSRSEETRQSMEKKAYDSSADVEQSPSRRRSVRKSITNFFSFGKK